MKTAEEQLAEQQQAEAREALRINLQRLDEAQGKTIEIIGLLNQLQRFDLTTVTIQGLGELHASLDKIRVALNVALNQEQTAS